MPCVRNLSVQRHGPPAGRLRQAPPRRAGLSCARAVPLFQPLLLRWAVSLPRDLRNPGPFRLRRQAAYARALRRGGPLFLRWQIPLCLQALKPIKRGCERTAKVLSQSPFQCSSPARFTRRKAQRPVTSAKNQPMGTDHQMPTTPMLGMAASTLASTTRVPSETMVSARDMAGLPSARYSP